MSNSVYGKTINSERDISRVINNSAYSKTIKEKTNTKKYQSYKNQSLEWKWNKKIFYFIIKQKELLFYNTFIKKPKITGLKNIKLLHEFIFYDEFALVYFNSTPKTVINSNMTLANLFKKFCTESAIGLIKNLVG